jgi:toxin-antitoxin system PIN domain toxin
VTTYLLDANVLIALTVGEHEHHDRATSWASGITSFAICPVVEGALLRFLVRLGESQTVASTVLRAIRDMRGCRFWPDDLSYSEVDLSNVRGHRQITDAYLVALVRRHPRSQLATMDEGLAELAPNATFVLPQ